MNSASEVLLQAIDTIVNNAVSKLEYDKTIQAEIYGIVNLDTGEYKVKYSGNIVSAFSTDIKKTYKIGDFVYIIIPEGDLSNKKFITAKVGDSLSYGEMISLSNSIKEVSPTFDVFYNYDASSERGVVAGAPIGSELSQQIIYNNIGQYNGLFQQYSKEYELIRIQASFLTRFHSEHVQGNYGLEIQFYTKSEDIVSYKLDLNSFNGDPYALSVYSPQSIIIKAQLGYLTGVKSIKLFEENFNYDRYVEGGLVTDKQNTTVPNIFVKDIAISFVEKKDLTDNSYYLDITTPQGNSFTSNITTIDLVARLIYQGDNILDEKLCTCKWYERDLSIMLGDKLYDKNAGVTWKPIESSSFGTLTLRSQDVIYQKQYKLVVIYNNSIILSDEVTIFNLNSAYNFELKQNTVGDEIQLQIVNNLNNEVLIGDWYLSYPDGSYSSFSSKKNAVDVTSFLLYSSVTFYCGVYNSRQTETIGILTHIITSSDSEEDITISYSGEDSFRYDANGDIAIEDAEKERTLQVILSWKDGVGTSYRVEWIGPDGKLLTNSRYTPTQSMIENLWVDNNNILHYTIKQKYKVNFNNNTITVKIITIDGKEFTFKKEILFLKDGDQGTNGTTYIAAIRPYNVSTGLKLSGLNPLIYRNNTWQNNLPLRCYVYKDGELINSDTHYEITYKWEGINVYLNNNQSEDRKTISGNNNIISYAATPYVKVQVSINDKMNGRKYDIYCSYPIDVAIGFTNQEISLLDIDSIPSYIKYTSSGINPSFYSNDIKFLYGTQDITSQVVSLTGDILTLQQQDNLYYLKPASSFIFDNNSIAMLKCGYTNNKYLYHPVILYLDTYGNEAINGWDGQKVTVNESGGYILAPQIGAGVKDSANRFSGIVMGKDSGQSKIGLYGYQAGINTFGLMENGVAYFGAKTSGAQIVIDGTTAKIYGGGRNPAGGSSQVGGDASNGMTITLANLQPSGNSDAIKIGAGVFKVSYDGSLIASKADITGAITANTGYLGGRNGWTIQEYRVYSSKSGSTHIELNCNPNETYAIWCGSQSSATAASSKFAVTKTGLLYAKEGNIGGWIMKSTYLQATSGTVGLASSGQAAFWAGSNLDANSSSIPTNSSEAKFLVTRSGKLYCSSADISGKITADSGEIAGWRISSNRLQNADGSVYLSSSSGLRVGNNFRVTNSGTLTASNANINGNIDADTLTCYSGYIGGWRITSDRLSAGGTRLYSDGSIDCDSLTAYNADISGDIYADYLECYSGNIGGWVINRNGFFGQNISLTPYGIFLTDGGSSTQAGIYVSNRILHIDTTSNRLANQINMSAIDGISISGGMNLYLQGSYITFDGNVSGLDTTARFG